MTALVLIDMQNDYFPNGKMLLPGIAAAAAKAGQLLEACRRGKHMIFHVQHLAARPGATFFLPQTTGAEIHPMVAPCAGEAVIVKHHPNSFHETDLAQRLRQAGIGQLVIAGAMSHMCIDASVRAAVDLGFSCTVAADACATRDLEFQGLALPAAYVHGAFMAALAAAYARVTTTDDVIATLQSDIAFVASNTPGQGGGGRSA
jgi:nicotinamidase-related amidase